ncbi:Hypothetical protein SRAE_1000346700 [Strongyloides ratti]|uniref:Uncharacterized protein n=1 Tax=Strongyloides ratti TaxID=34506 RepID=A0A090MXC9_STRRB|nr:Hypothetical protein SRAE_1000346700 [Strongyloides ratti]CEF65214.1 Hypothetical protein SRAE_1000346700 [Strongyloides ratti]
MYCKIYTFIFILLAIFNIIFARLLPQEEESLKRIKRQHGWHHGGRHHGGWHHGGGWHRPYYHHWNPYWGHHHGPWWW